MSPLMISLTVFVGVSAFVGAIASLLMGEIPNVQKTVSMCLPV